MLRWLPRRGDARVLLLGDCRVDVIEVLDRWLAPDHRYFKIRGGDGDTYIVRQDSTTGEWTRAYFDADPAKGR